MLYMSKLLSVINHRSITINSFDTPTQVIRYNYNFRGNRINICKMKQTRRISDKTDDIKTISSKEIQYTKLQQKS